MSCVLQGAATATSHAMMSSSRGGVTARLTRRGGAAGRLAPRSKEEWVLTFLPRWRGRTDPMTGWWGGGDPLETVTLRFPSRQAAENYARREGIVLEVSDAPGTIGAANRVSIPVSERIDPILPWVWDGRAALMDLDAGEASANRVDAELALLNPAAAFSAPMDVARHPRLTRQEKLEILRRWEWDARLIESAQAEGMPDRGEPSRLEEVLEARRALLDEQRRGDRTHRASAGLRRVPARPSRHAGAGPEWRIAA